MRCWMTRKRPPQTGDQLRTFYASASSKYPTAPSAARGLLRLRTKQQLLHAPVQNFGDEQHVFGRACNLVNPAELFELLAGAAEHAEHLAVETELVDTTRVGIGAVQHLVRRRRDADRPGRAGRKAAARRQVVGEVRFVADRRARIRIEWHIDLDLAQELALAIEYLNPAVVAVGDVNVAVGICRDAVGEIELTGLLAAFAP